MRITQLKIENFRGFGQFEMTLPDNNLAVFIGNNGKGKSSLLDAVAILLTPLVNQLSTIKGSYNLNKNDINKQEKEVLLGVNITNKDETYTWQVFKNGRSGVHNLNQIQEVATQVAAKESQMPVLIYYKSTRTTISVEKTKFETPLEVYDYGFSKNTHNFYGFITWFRLEEDKENEQIRRARDFNLLNPELEVIRSAIPLFFKNLHQETTYTNLRVNRESRDKNNDNFTSLYITKDEIDFELEQLSDGEKVLLMTVCDIARRLAIANPKTEPLQGEGIVLIDELELHLHPQWQRTVVSALQATFPNIQFLLTTHSPQVLSEVPQESIFILENGIVKKPALNNFGRDSNTILEDTMQTSKRPIKIEQFSQAYFRAINANDFEKADALKQEWIGILDKNDPIFVQGQAIITRKQLLAQ